MTKEYTKIQKYSVKEGYKIPFTNYMFVTNEYTTYHTKKIFPTEGISPDQAFDNSKTKNQDSCQNGK